MGRRLLPRREFDRAVQQLEETLAVAPFVLRAGALMSQGPDLFPGSAFGFAREALPEPGPIRDVC